MKHNKSKVSQLELAKALIAKQNLSRDKKRSVFEEGTKRSVVQFQKDLSDIELILKSSNQSLEDVRQDVLKLSHDILKLNNYNS
ncbi:MAG: hypothetical protein ACI9FN_000608 [Saprospiraceae bacterium]|jgi:hypothetical protein